MVTNVQGITLVPISKRPTTSDLLTHFPNTRRVFAVDFYVEGAEDWAPKPWGWLGSTGELEVFNVDHHAPAAAMMRAVSSGNLAANFVREFGPVCSEAEATVAINHCDTDSVIASAMLRGLVSTEQRFEEAVVAADHTGAENFIADALQALESRRDLELSLSTLKALRDGTALPRVSQEALESRQQERQALFQLLSDRPELLKRFGVVTLLEGEERVPAEMLPAALPDAVVILTTSPMETGYAVKVRLGNAAPTGHTLFSLGIREFDPEFGGRWNAGSNKRGKGTALEPSEYARRLAQFVEEKLNE